MSEQVQYLTLSLVDDTPFTQYVYIKPYKNLYVFTLIFDSVLI